MFRLPAFPIPIYKFIELKLPPYSLFRLRIIFTVIILNTMEQGNLPIYTATSEQTPVSAPSTESISSSTEVSTPPSAQLILSMVNTLVDSRLSTILPPALANSINANPATQLITPSTTSHSDLLSIFQSLQSNNSLHETQPPPPAPIIAPKMLPQVSTMMVT